MQRRVICLCPILNQTEYDKFDSATTMAHSDSTLQPNLIDYWYYSSFYSNLANNCFKVLTYQSLVVVQLCILQNVFFIIIVILFSLSRLTQELKEAVHSQLDRLDIDDLQPALEDEGVLQSLQQQLDMAIQVSTIIKKYINIS